MSFILALVAGWAIVLGCGDSSSDLPKQVDLRPRFEALQLGPASQGRRNTCSVFVTVSAFEYAMSSHLNETTRLSVEYANWAANQVVGNTTVDRGQFFHHLLKGIDEHGLCRAALMPYESKYGNTQPSIEAKKDASELRQLKPAVHWIRPWSKKQGLTEVQFMEVKRVLALGHPVCAGSDHSRLLIGYFDDETIAGGGKFLTRDSGLGRDDEVTFAWAKANIFDLFWVQLESKPQNENKVVGSNNDSSQQANPKMKEQRKKFARKKRSLILDNDGNDCLGMKSISKEEFLRQRTSDLAGTGLNCIYYCSNATFGLSTRSSSAWQMRDYRASGRVDGYNVADLDAAGIDSLALIVEFAHAQGMEVFSSIRMNDVHDHSTSNEYGSPMFLHNQWKQSHLNYLLGTSKKKSKSAAWSGVNFAKPEVRDHLFAYAEEACRGYDIDGLSLDFFRHPAFFPSTFSEKVAGQDELSAMTSLLHQIRDLADRVGSNRNRPLLISVRVPDSVEYCRAIGLDIQAWLEQDLVDIIATTGYFQLNDWDESVRLGKKYDVPVYASLDEARMKDVQGATDRNSLDGYRGRASVALEAGVDGVLLFNYFDPKSPLWNQLDSREKLRGLPKKYFGSIRGLTRANGGNLPYDKYLTVETLTPDTPRPLLAGKENVAKISLGALNTERFRYTLGLRFAGKDVRDATLMQFSVKLNGTPVSLIQIDNNWCNYAVDPSSIHPGSNQVTVAIPKDNPKALNWLDVRIEESE